MAQVNVRDIVKIIIDYVPEDKTCTGWVTRYDRQPVRKGHDYTAVIKDDTAPDGQRFEPITQKVAKEIVEYWEDHPFGG